MVYEEKTISSEMIYQGAILNLRRDKVLVIGDKESYREIVEHNGGVAVAAITSDQRILLVNQYRKAAEQVVLEVPAGKIEKDELDPLATAVRELKEETGYTALHWKWLSTFYSSIGYSTEKIHLYLATGLTEGETDFDDNEAIELLEMDLKEAKDKVRSGEIMDAKTIAAILLVESEMDRMQIQSDSQR